MKGIVPEADYLLPLGKAAVKRTGKDVTIIGTSWMVQHALEAAETLDEEGIDCEVIDPRTLYPLDTRTIIESVRKTGRCVVVCEQPAAGSFSSELSATESGSSKRPSPPASVLKKPRPPGNPY